MSGVVQGGRTAGRCAIGTNFKLLTGSKGTYAVSALDGITTSNTVTTPTTLSATIARHADRASVVRPGRRRDEGVAMHSPASDLGNRRYAALMVAASTRQNDPLVVART